MLKQEFETLVGCEVPASLYALIEVDYMAAEDSKANYVSRVFGKCKWAVDVLDKFVKKQCADNRKALTGNKTATEDKLRDMDAAIYYHYAWTLSDQTAKF